MTAMAFKRKVLAAFLVGVAHGAAGAPITPTVVPGTAACVTAYVAGHGKGWLDAHTAPADLIDDREDGAFH